MEGPDGSGKSTQIEALRAFFRQRGNYVVVTREPGGTGISEAVRDVLLDIRNSEMDPMAETLLYAASRAQLVSEVIRPALEAGKIVICDRFTDSSMAYQGYGRRLGDSVRVINEYATGGLEPDITFLMMLEPEKGRARMSGSEPDRVEAESIEFHREVYRGYRELLRRFPDRIIGIDASLPAEEISEIITEKVAGVLKERGYE